MQVVSVASQLPLARDRLGVRALSAMVQRQWLVHFRWIFIIAMAALLTIERMQTGTFARPAALLVWIVISAFVNTIWMSLGRKLAGRDRHTVAMAPSTIRALVAVANVQIGFDLLFLTMVLRYAGGIENPLAVVNAVFQGLLALLLYGAVLVGERTGFLTPHFPMFPSMPDLELHMQWRFVLAGMGALAVGVFGTLYAAIRMRSHVKQREEELCEAGEALRRSQAAIKELQTRRSRFMQTAAHQLKSPVAGIETLAGLVRDDVVPAGDIPGIIERIIERCRQATVQVAHLLTLARLSDSSPNRHRSIGTPVGALIERVVARFGEQVKTKGLTLHVDAGSGDTPAIAADGGDFDDCFANLLDNAIKYTAAGGTIRVTVVEERDAVSISVEDSGIGISEDRTDDLFEPFRRGNQALRANIPGTGLGLSIVREVVEQAGGRISVRSAAGEGSEFTVSFPKQPGGGREASDAAG